MAALGTVLMTNSNALLKTGILLEVLAQGLHLQFRLMNNQSNLLFRHEG